LDQDIVMGEYPCDRYAVLVEEGVPRGGLFELEQTTYYRVVEVGAGRVMLTFRGEMEASLSTETGTWDDYRYSGVSGVTIALDGKSVTVRYHDGREEKLPLHQPDLD
jgi:hypothetical protein